MSTQPGGNIHKQRIYETPGSLTTRECPLHIKIWNAFLQISTLFWEGKVGSGCLEGGQREGGTLHINKPDDRSWRMIDMVKLWCYMKTH